MPESDDHHLLAEFVRSHSEGAFTELVSRHAGLVYATALRFCGNPHQAEEISQAVFIILARKAGTLSRRVVISGWLYQTARLTAANFVKGEIRRRQREQEALMQSTPEETDSAHWKTIAPLLDEAMGGLGETDRHAVQLRYFENRTSSEIGAALRMNEETARKRVNRALEKLRHFFVKRGVTVSSSALSGAISANAIHPVSATMVKNISAAALTKGAAASTSTLTLTQGVLKIMAWTKAKIIVCAAIGVALAATVSIVVVRKESLVQGKTEVEWIKSIEYRGGDQQTALWHSLGPRGIRMLVHALKPPPRGLTEEQESASRKTRMCAADVLLELANNYNEKSAAPELIKLLHTETDDSVRGVELGYFERPILSMSEKEKADLLPELIRSVTRNHAGERNNALVALRHYTNQSDAVLPLLASALHDPTPGVRVMAASALHDFDPNQATNSDLVSVLAQCVTAPPLDMPGAANEAIVLLGTWHEYPDVAVPALIQALQSDNTYSRNNAAAALGKFGSQARAALPTLQTALNDPDANVRRQVAGALKSIN